VFETVEKEKDAALTTRENWTLSADARPSRGRSTGVAAVGRTPTRLTYSKNRTENFIENNPLSNLPLQLDSGPAMDCGLGGTGLTGERCAGWLRQRFQRRPYRSLDGILLVSPRSRWMGMHASRGGPCSWPSAPSGCSSLRANHRSRPFRSPCILQEPCDVSVFTDSKYVQEGMSRLVPLWHANRWRNSRGRHLPNQRLWLELASAAVRHRIHW